MHLYTNICALFWMCAALQRFYFLFLTLFAWKINWLHLCFTFFATCFQLQPCVGPPWNKKNYMQVAEFLIKFSFFTSAPSYSEKKKKALLKQIYNSNICKSRGKKRGLGSTNILEYWTWMCQYSSSSYLFEWSKQSQTDSASASWQQ